jgi:hypothetical protein
MTTAGSSGSTVLVPAEPLFTLMSGLRWPGFGGLQRADPRCVHPGSTSVHVVVRRAWAELVHRTPRGYRVLWPRDGGDWPGAGDGRSSAVHHRRVLPVRRRGGPARAFTSGARAPATIGLRVARGRVGSQRGRSTAGRCRTRHRRGARVDLAAGDQQAADLRSARRRHRPARSGTRTPHPDRPAQGRQDRHHPPRPAHRPRHRPGHRRTG